MSSYEFDIGAKARAGSRFLHDVRDEIRRAFSIEKGRTRITQQTIAERLGVNRSVVNRQIMGLENLTAKSIGELLWAVGWEPHFEARKLDVEFGVNNATRLPADSKHSFQDDQSRSSQQADPVLRLLRGLPPNRDFSQQLGRRS